MEHHEAHPALEITEGRVGLLGVDRRSRPRARPRLPAEREVPAPGRYFDPCWRLPKHGRDMADTEVPCPQGQRDSGGRVAFLLGLLLCHSAPCVADGRGHPHRPTPRWHSLFGPSEDGSLDQLTLDPVAPLGQGTVVHPAGTQGQKLGLMLEARENIRTRESQACQGLDGTRAES